MLLQKKKKTNNIDEVEYRLDVYKQTHYLCTQVYIELWAGHIRKTRFAFEKFIE